MKLARIALVVMLGAATAHAQNKEAHEKDEAGEVKDAAALAAALKDAKVSLADGLKAAEKSGTPISAKFELEDGKLQLSVYTMKGDKFAEVIVDHKTGKVTKTEPIAGGEDLTAAKKQAEAMAKTKRSLRDVVAKAEKANAGYKAVGVWADMESSGAKADVNLVKGSESKHVEDKL
jgi:flagellar hook-basal body complex protein FliE